MLTIGIDTHTSTHSLCVRDEDCRIIGEHRVEGGKRELVAFLRKKFSQPIRVGYEASLGYGTLYDMLTPFVEEVKVGHPGALRMIFASKKKTDRIDADKICKLLAMDEFPAIHVPKVSIRDWRAMIEHRRKQVDKLVMAKNGLRAFLRSLEVPGLEEHKGARLWSKVGIAWIKGLAFASPINAMRRNQLVKEVEYYVQGIKELEVMLDALAGAHPGVALLETIPGVGPRTAEAVMAYVDDPKRFSRSRQASAYFGLVPSLDESASISRRGHITRQGPATVRKYLVECVWQARRRSPTIQAFFDRVKDGKKSRTGKAIVATARHLVQIMMAMLKSGEVWRETLPQTQQGPQAGVNGEGASRTHAENQSDVKAPRTPRRRKELNDASTPTSGGTRPLPPHPPTPHKVLDSTGDQG